MKLMIKKNYFDQIKAGTKTEDFRDAHITFVCEETEETLRKDVVDVRLVRNIGDYPDVLTEDVLVCFKLGLGVKKKFME